MQAKNRMINQQNLEQAVKTTDFLPNSNRTHKHVTTIRAMLLSTIK